MSPSSMSPSRMSLPPTMRRLLPVLFGAVLLAPTLATAQPLDNPDLPRARYALPEPVERGPDLDDLINGNGKLHFSGQWRGWSDSRNTGEIAQMLLAPETVRGRGRTPNGLPSSRYCYDNPDRC